jgi:hypothetical protein
MPLVEQELLTLPEPLSSSTVFSGFKITRSLVLRLVYDFTTKEKTSKDTQNYSNFDRE